MRVVTAEPVLEVRAARPSDLPELRALVERCSPETLYRRFHGVVGHAMQRELVRITTPVETHRSWVAVDRRTGAIHGTATLAWGRDGTVEAAFLVEDGWFRHGIGRMLFAAVARDARAAGVPEVVAWVQGDNERARRFLRAMAPGGQVSFAGGGELQFVLPTHVRRPAAVHATPATFRESA
jgi:N-acetylglutamate synthase-like GNAT family acetyltransferase